MDLHQFADNARATGGALVGPQMKKVMDGLGVAVKADAQAAVKSDLGSAGRFSGWKTEPLAVRYTHAAPGRIVVSPTPATVGPWVVAQLGRHQGNASGFQGPGVSRSTGLTARTKSGGVRRVRDTRGRQWNGSTKALHTFSDFVRVSDQKMSGRLAAPVAELLRKGLGV